MSKYFPMIGAASLTCSEVLPLMIASSSNSNAQPSLPTLNTIASIPKFCAAICVLNRVRILGFKNKSPMRLFAPSDLSTNGFALYDNAFSTKASMLFTSLTEMNCFNVVLIILLSPVLLLLNFRCVTHCNVLFTLQHLDRFFQRTQKVFCF